MQRLHHRRIGAHQRRIHERPEPDLETKRLAADRVPERLERRQRATGVNQQPLIDHMMAEHLSPENVGRLAAAAGVKTLVLTHFATPPGADGFDAAAMLAAIRRHFDGQVIFGQDLTSL